MDEGPCLQDKATVKQMNMPEDDTFAFGLLMEWVTPETLSVLNSNVCQRCYRNIYHQKRT
jgi:hypothetical protein